SRPLERGGGAGGPGPQGGEGARGVRRGTREPALPLLRERRPAGGSGHGPRAGGLPLRRRASPGPLNGSGGVLRAIVTLEPLLLLALVPFLWFPRPGSALVLVLVPLLWAVRRAATGRWSVRTSYDLPIVAMLVLLPLSLMPVVDWSLATPRLYGLLLGVAM